MSLLCRLGSISAHRDHFVLCLSVGVCVFGSLTFLDSDLYCVLQATHAFLGMLPFWFFF